MSRTRRRFSAAEKAKIALEAIKGEQTIAELVKKYSVHATQISQWKKAALEQLPEAFSGKKNQEVKEVEAELSNLYEQIGRLQVENAFLKKKCDMFT